MTYSELLRHPFWQKRRLEIMQRDGFKCRKCSDILKNLQVHHLYYIPETLPWDYPDDALITVCDLCHEKEEFKKWFIINVLRLRADFTSEDISNIKEIVLRRVELNMHRQTVTEYMNQIRGLINNG